jgi:ankyrin repeat protein
VATLSLFALKSMRAQDYFDSKEQVQLASAAQRGNIAGMKQAIAAGADVNAVGHEGMTPLFWTIAKQNLRAFKSLLDSGANPNVATTWTNSRGVKQTAGALETAAVLENSEYLLALLQHGGNPNLVIDRSGETPIYQAIMHRRLENVKILVAQGADLEHKDMEGTTPIRQAATARMYETALFLLRAGADPAAENNWGSSAVEIVKKFGDRGIYEKSNDLAAYGEFVTELKKRGLME